MKKKFKLFDSDSLKSFHKRIFFSILIFIFFYFIGIYRISDVMLFYEKDLLHNLSSDKQERGKIFDRNGNLLATTINSYSIFTNPNKLKNKKLILKKISKILNIKEKKLSKILFSEKKFVWIKRNITPTEHQAIIDLGEINLRILKEKKRIYPYQNEVSHIVGYVNIDQKGQGGIERSQNKKLAKSNDIFLTIDINLQQSVREKLINTIKKYRANSGSAIVMDINNGQILSSVSFPDFDPNNNETYNKESLVNRVVQSNYEMGSTFKPITVAMGIDKGLINPNMTFDVSKKYKGINDYLKYEENGIYNVEKIIVKSSNIGTAKIASIIGKSNQIEFFKKIGFYNKLNIELLESSKPLGNKNNWGALETMTIGYGHGFAITPLHLVKAYSSIANNGNESIPTLILKKQNLNKNKILQNNDTSKFFLKLLKSVVTKTNVAGPNVKIEGYDIGGKTGTAMLVNKKGGYYRDRDLTSFIGIFPIEKPKYIVLTIIEYPKKPINSNIKTTGGTVNAPLVKKIILDMIRILNIPKYKNSDILKADINSIYYLKNATL